MNILNGKIPADTAQLIANFIDFDEDLPAGREHTGETGLEIVGRIHVLRNQRVTRIINIHAQIIVTTRILRNSPNSHLIPTQDIGLKVTVNCGSGNRRPARIRCSRD